LVGIPVPPEGETEQKTIGSLEENIYDEAMDLYGDDMPDIPPGTFDLEGDTGVMVGVGAGVDQGRFGTGTSRGVGKGNGGEHGGTGGNPNRVGYGSGTRGKRSPGLGGGRPFISYVGTHPHDEERDPDGIDQATRMRIEDQAIEMIIDLEPTLRRTPAGNLGFDLYEADGNGKPVRWVEIKSMTGSLDDRPVGLSYSQFNCAREHGAAYWLYVVEHATDPRAARVLKIQDPVSHVRTFTFDKGWRHIAKTDFPH